MVVYRGCLGVFGGGIRMGFRCGLEEERDVEKVGFLVFFILVIKFVFFVLYIRFYCKIFFV